MINGAVLDAANLSLDLAALQALPIHWQSYDFTLPQQTLQHCHNAQVIITSKVRLDGQTLAQLSSLKLICVAATGTDNIDLNAAALHGVEVKNVADYAGSSVAQLVFSLLLELTTHASRYNQRVRNGEWSKTHAFCLTGETMMELAGKTMGLIGYGNLAKSVEKLAKAFDMRVIIADHKQANTLRPGRHSFANVITESDVISIHCPLTPTTKDLFSMAEFKQMKPSALLINTARGGIVNEEDLIEALNNNEIAGAALDVIAIEPPPVDYPLIVNQPENLIITPHIAWTTPEAKNRLLKQLIANIRSSLKQVSSLAPDKSPVLNNRQS